MDTVTNWRKSSHSSNQGYCGEVAFTEHGIAATPPCPVERLPAQPRARALRDLSVAHTRNRHQAPASHHRCSEAACSGSARPELVRSEPL
ncbi:hypothetical protein FHR84_004504 [Actinopolyspora biskrensis]|uniref:DUF397 domain-containing protein n=1 Tax=Actinopolyspora biskrensis TaxID=1470178 RepID=A0A852ZCA0_9ACTN|nr:hypothetical protein [Actinopolyspora biskrensis]